VLLVFARLPSQVERINRDAVPAETGAGVEGHESEGFGGGGIDDVPDVDVHLLEDDFEFIDEGNIDGAEDVLGQLRRLGDAAGADRMDGIEGERVQLDAAFEALRRVAAHDLGDGLDRVVLAAGILPLGGIGQMKAFAFGADMGDSLRWIWG